MDHSDFLRAPTAVIAGACVSVFAIFTEYWMQNNLGQHAGLWNWCDENLGTCVAVDDVHKSWEDPYLGGYRHHLFIYLFIYFFFRGGGKIFLGKNVQNLPIFVLKLKLFFGGGMGARIFFGGGGVNDTMSPVAPPLRGANNFFGRGGSQMNLASIKVRPPYFSNNNFMTPHHRYALLP